MHLSPGATASGNSNVSLGCRGSPVINDQRWLPQGEFLKPQSPDDPSIKQSNGGGTIAGSPVRERHSSALRRKTEYVYLLYFLSRIVRVDERTRVRKTYCSTSSRQDTSRRVDNRFHIVRYERNRRTDTRLPWLRKKNNRDNAFAAFQLLLMHTSV